jgi:spore germination protein KB
VVVDKTEIKGVRFMFTVAFFLQSSVLLTSFLNSILRQDSWLGVMFGIVLTLPVIWLYRTLMLEFPDKNLLQVLEQVFGKILGKIIGIGYAWFFLTLAALNLSDLSHFTNLSIMNDTPAVVLMIICIIVSAWAIKYGINVVTRFSAAFVIFEFIVTATFLLLVINQLEMKNFLPIFAMEPIKYIQGTHVSATIPFGELVVFLMLTPNLKLDGKKITKYWFGGVAMGMFTVLGVLMRDIAILGETMELFKLPGLITIRLISMGEAFSRMEILFALALMVLLFFKVTLLCYVSTVTFAYIFKTKAYRYLALITGVLVITYIPILFKTPIEKIAFARRFAPFLFMLFEIIIPFVIYIVAKMRKMPQKARQQGAEA